MCSIYTLEKELNNPAASATDPEASPLLLHGDRDDPDRVFREALDKELERITSFFDFKEPEVYTEVDELLKDQEAFEADQQEQEGQDGSRPPGRRRTLASFSKRRTSIFQDWGLTGFNRNRRASAASQQRLERIDSDDDEDGEDEQGPALKKTQTTDTNGSGRSGSFHGERGGSILVPRKNSEGFEDSSDRALSIAYDAGATLKKRMVSLYVSVCELRSFVQLNKTGFSKVLKKYDKTLDRSLKKKYLAQQIETARAFRPETSDAIGDKIAQIEQIYANQNTQGNIEEAKRMLRLDLREHVVWERNTVWREMIGIERKAQAANLGTRRTLLGGGEREHLQGDDGAESSSKEVDTPIGRYRCPSFLLNSTFYFLVVDIAVFLVLLLVPIMELPEQQNCLAMVAFVSLLWATEVRP